MTWKITVPKQRAKRVAPKRTKPPILARTRMSPTQIDKLLRAYCERLSPDEAANRAKVSTNTAYRLYHLLRYRLVAARYYVGGATSFDDPTLGPELQTKLRARRGLRTAMDIYLHSAELQVWDDEWPPALVRKHILKVVELTGPLDREPALSPSEAECVEAYVRYARSELIYRHKVDSAVFSEEGDAYNLKRAKLLMGKEHRQFRAALKRYTETFGSC